MSATKPGAAPSGPGDTRLVVTDFGPIARAEVTLRPLTVFAGPHHTGKSVLATLLYALHGNAFRRALTERGSWSAAAQRPEAAPSLVAEPVPPWLEPAEESSAVPSESEPALRARCEAEAARAFAAEVCRCFGVPDPGPLRRRVGSLPDSIRPAAIEWGTSPAANAPSMRFELGDGDSTPAVSARLSNLASIPSVAPRTRSSFGDSRGPEDSAVASLTDERSRSLLQENFGPALRAAYFLPADRSGIVLHHGAVLRDSIPETASADSPGVSPVPLLSGVATDLLEQAEAIGRNAADRTRRNPLAAEIEERILGGSVLVEPNAAGMPDFAFRPKEWSGDDLPLRRTSAMVSSLAPVVLWLRHLVGHGDVLIIEEPEAHVHPEKQTELARQLVRMIRSGIRVVITTHSEWMVEQLGNLTQLSNLPAERREGIEDAALALEPKEIGVWLFRQNSKQGGAAVEEVTLDPESWLFPVDYDRIGLDLYNQSAHIYNRTQALKE